MTDKNDLTSPTVVGARNSARGFANPKVRLGLIAGFVVLGGLVLLKVVVPNDGNKMPKSKAENDLAKIVEDQNKAGNKAGNLQNTGKFDQPAGDKDAIAALNAIDTTDKLRSQAKVEAEDRMLAQLAKQHYIRRSQGLRYEPPLAAEWERRLREAQSKGLAAPADAGDLSAENIEQVKKTQPELYAKWVAMRGEMVTNPALAAASGGVVPPAARPAGHAAGSNPTVASAPGAGLALGQVPAGIDPKTGLPSSAAAVSGDVEYAILEDGSPDIGRGAIPVTVRFDLPGSKEQIQKTVWIRPGYLTGRSRPIDPVELKAEDDAYRRALKDPTDIPADPSHSVAIPYRYTNTKTRVSPGSDFNWQNRYVVVLPNPAGKLNPPNPPKQGKGDKR